MYSQSVAGSDSEDDCVCDEIAGFIDVDDSAGVSCVCPEGMELSSDGGCTACAEGYHKSKPGLELCEACEAGTSTDGTGGTSCSICAADTYCQSGEAAKPCPVYSQSVAGSDSEDDCKCRLGYFDLDNSLTVSCKLRSLEWTVFDYSVREDGGSFDVVLFEIQSLVTDRFNFSMRLSSGDEGIFLLPPVETLTLEEVSPSYGYVARGNMTIAVAPNKFGYSIWDITITDLSYDGGPAPVSQIKQVAITVQPVNDAPSFNLTADRFFTSADSGFQTFACVQNISAGPDEQQSLSFRVVQLTGPSMDDRKVFSSLFETIPHIETRSGTLSMSLAPQLGYAGSGNTTWKVVLIDDGGTEYGGKDRSPATMFAVEVLKRPVGVLSLQFRQNTHAPTDIEVRWGLEENGLMNVDGFTVALVGERTTFEKRMSVSKNVCGGNEVRPCSVTFSAVVNPGLHIYARVIAQNIAGFSEVQQTQPTVLVGAPSTPRNVSVVQGPVPSNTGGIRTKFTFEWAPPVDFGDARSPDDEKRIMLREFRVNITCADKKGIVMGVSAAFSSLDVEVGWINDQFKIAAGKDQLSCVKGQTLSTSVIAVNDFFGGESSTPVGIRAMGLPGPVRSIKAAETILSTGLKALNVSFLIPVDTGFGDETAPVTQLLVQASLCKSFDASLPSCDVREVLRDVHEARKHFVLLETLTPGTVYFVRAAVANLVGFVPADKVQPITVDFFVMPNLAASSMLRIALPHSVSNSYDVWDNGVKSSNITLQIFSLPSVLRKGDRMIGQFTFDSEAAPATVTAPISETNAVGARSIRFSPNIEVPTSCTRSCTAMLKVFPAAFPDKFVTKPVTFMAYAWPKLLTAFPESGSEQGGTLVRLSIVEFPGDATNPSRCMAGRTCLLNEPPALHVAVSCPGMADSIVQPATLKFTGNSVFLVSFLTPQCAEGTANLTLTTKESVFPLELGRKTLQFRYKGTVVNSVTPPSGMTNPGSGGVALNIYIDNVQGVPKNTVSVTLAGLVCTSLSTSAFSEDTKRLFLQVKTPELNVSLAGSLPLLVSGVVPGKDLSFSWTFTPPPDMYFEADMFTVEGDARAWVSSSKEVVQRVAIVISNLHPSYGRTFDEVKLDIRETDLFIEGTPAFSIQRVGPLRTAGKQVAAVFEIQCRNCGAGRFYFVSALIFADSVQHFAVSAFSDGRIGAWLEARDTSQPRLLASVPSEAPSTGGTLVLLGFLEGASLQQQVNSGLAKFFLNGTEGVVAHAISLANYSAKGAAYELAASKARHFSRASETLFRQYMGVPAALAQAVALDRNPDVAAEKATLLFVESPPVVAGPVRASVVWDKFGAQQAFSTEFLSVNVPSGTPVVQVLPINVCGSPIV